jgi:ribosomal protein S1
MKKPANRFEELLEESFKKRKSLESGSAYFATVTDIKEDYIFIKTKDNIQGILSKEEFINEPIPNLGTELKVYFLRESHGDYYFTYLLNSETLNWEMIELAFANEIPISAQFSHEVSNGYEIKLGQISAFCPFSQVDIEQKSKNLIGVKSNFIIHEIQSKSKRIILSSKKLMDKERSLKRDILKKELKVDSYITASVKSIHKFGLIVDLNGIDALVPISESSFKRNPDLSEEFHIGQTVKGQIISIDWDTNKISISLKSTLKDPWANSIPFKEGDIREGIVESIKPFGLFVKLNDTFHCLVPNKESGLPIRTPLSTKFKEGDKIEVFIQEINPTKRQISASIEKAKNTKEELEYQSYLSDQEVSHVSSFGLLLQKNLKKSGK